MEFAIRFWNVILGLLLFLVCLMLYNELVRHYTHRQQVTCSHDHVYHPLLQELHCSFDQSNVYVWFCGVILVGVLGRPLLGSCPRRLRGLEVWVAPRGLGAANHEPTGLSGKFPRVLHSCTYTRALRFLHGL